VLSVPVLATYCVCGIRRAAGVTCNKNTLLEKALHARGVPGVFLVSATSSQWPCALALARQAWKKEEPITSPLLSSCVKAVSRDPAILVNQLHLSNLHDASKYHHTTWRRLCITEHANNKTFWDMMRLWAYIKETGPRDQCLEPYPFLAESLHRWLLLGPLKPQNALCNELLQVPV
jgi:hypothetical protein